MIIIGGTATNGIDENLSKIISVPLLKVEHKVFPDGESYIRIPQHITNQEILVVQSLYPPQDKHFVELLLILETLADMKNNKITAIVPYLAYSRQDRRFKEGEALSIKTILNAIARAGADVLIVIEPHKEEELSYFGKEVKIADPMPELAKEVSKKVEKPFVLAPDRGALERAKRLAEQLNAEYSYIEKERDRDTGEVRIKNLPELRLSGKDVIIVDDIISTGGTMIQATRAAYEHGARKVISVAVHSLFLDNAYEKLINSGVKEIVTTNTIPQDPSKVTVVDVSPAIARKI
ncbi:MULTISPECIES: ribose-phosphate diphosphokinase [Sulfurisphaera]|uniref:Ribose-phosphate pyrophosphokinase n=2 Tax=Sulfurisphaera tokodaii TaxID=111955 RepID=KPRS_SULTO|nr:ribose-phosphate diphosphokinase [Sulfurisphaera tokodaii]Q973F3.1 RecName: Full=Ribose-phosphate pyrophosphokinase; Short=RPPK; AltName: Full=5-phospho-D-ribosyl alpha-1-diphosphate synthase; AltName: Full=Phosphoribosyl diphosphate synthase; AltName: Full=Phosphoribosyl pyrophosphate synthase; Short=P-Rib-PP synthase; Short=PRPP synthase; Short=PRPPase [Sulfurisphaera tokodaii str. 7]BAK54418.1 phosphoribosyl pyrophosphate synthetase [Sulfurisphaera tokodaii str. 7]HII73920.1 ribose-phospha